MRGPESPPTALSESETGYRADHSTVFGASHDTFRRQRFLGVGGSGRSPLESADPQVRRAGRWSKQGGRKLRKQYRGGGGLGVPCGCGPKPCTAEMHGILHMADVSGQGRGTGCSGPLFGVLRVPSGTFGVRNWLPRRPQHGFRSFPRHVSTTSFPWGRRQWAQPSRIRRPHMGCRRVGHGLG